MKGCEINPNSEDLWLEAARLELETKDKKKLFGKALEHIQNSVRLWKAAVEYEDPEDAKLLLARAVECCPSSVELWLALARLETYENAQRVLKKARQNIPTDRLIWITAAKLEEAHGNMEMVDNVIELAISSLVSNGVEMTREQWLEDAIEAAKAGSHLTCRAIVKSMIGYGLHVQADEERIQTWTEDANYCVSKGAMGCARAIFAHALSNYPTKKSLWRRAFYFEKTYGDQENFEKILQNAVTTWPKAEILWLMGSKSKWVSAGDVQQSDRRLLSLDFQARKAFVKSIKLEWALGDIPQAFRLLEEGLQTFPRWSKLWTMKGKLEAQSGNLDTARDVYAEGTKKCPGSEPLWLNLARIEESRGRIIEARHVMDTARLRNPRNDRFWLESIRIEIRAGEKHIAETLTTKALQECPTSGILWANAIFMESRAQRKRINKAVEALRICDKDVNVLLTVCKLLWSERKLVQCREWFNRTIEIEPDNGDVWANFFKFELIHGNQTFQQEILKRCLLAEPRHGEAWCKISKDMRNWKLPTHRILAILANELPIPN